MSKISVSDDLIGMDQIDEKIESRILKALNGIIPAQPTVKIESISDWFIYQLKTFNWINLGVVIILFVSLQTIQKQTADNDSTLRQISANIYHLQALQDEVTKSLSLAEMYTANVSSTNSKFFGKVQSATRNFMNLNESAHSQFTHLVFDAVSQITAVNSSVFSVSQKSIKNIQSLNYSVAHALSKYILGLNGVHTRLENLELNQNVGSYISVSSYTGKYVQDRCVLASLKPSPLKIIIPETGVYFVQYNGRLVGLRNGDSWWSSLIYHKRCGCPYSTAFGNGLVPSGVTYSQGDASSGNSWIGPLLSGDEIELRFWVRGSGTGNIDSAYPSGVNSIQAIFLRPISNSTCALCVPVPISYCP